MRKSVNRNHRFSKLGWRLFFLGILLGMVLNFQLNQISSAENETPQNEYLDMVKQGKEAEDIVVLYHKKLNDLFNKRIETFLTADPEKELPILNKISDPILDPETKKPTGKRKECEGFGEKPNVTTFCLARDSVNEYFKFRTAVRKTLQSIDLTGREFQKIQEKTQAKTVFIEREIDIARKTLDLSLQAYSEFQMSYPLHRKYQEVISALTTYRDKTSSLRRVVEQIPNTFYNATTTQCL